VRARALAALAAAVGLAGGACGGGKGAAPATPLAGSPIADPADRLMAFVPPDVTFVFVRDQQAGLADRFSDISQVAGALQGARAALDPSDGPGTAFFAALLDALVVPGAARDAIGWREGESALVMYGLGFDTYVRATLDGARLRATLDGAAAKSRFPLVPVTTGGHTYYRVEIPTPAFSMWLVLRVDDRGLVAGLGGDAARLLDQVLADRPSGPRFDTAAVVAAAYPDRRPQARFSMAIFPQRLSAALRALVVRRPAWLAPVQACAEAGAELLAVTPSFRFAWVPAPGRFEAVGLLDVAPATADRLARELQPIPRWSDDDARMRAGIGVGPRTLLDVVQPWLDVVDTVGRACSDEESGGGSSLAMLRSMMAPPPMALIGSAMIEVEPRSRSVTAVVGARDPQALWAAIRSMVPLRPQPPAPGEQVSFQGAVFMSGGGTLGVAVGDGGAAALTALMAGEPGPRELFAFDIPRGVLDELRQSGDSTFTDNQFGSLAFHVGVREGRVVVAMAAESVGPVPQLAR
jgi:hypothetical protein